MGVRNTKSVINYKLQIQFCTVFERNMTNIDVQSKIDCRNCNSLKEYFTKEVTKEEN